MTLTNDELYSAFLADVNNVYGVFQNFFGEDYVDLQGVPAKDDFFSYVNCIKDSQPNLSDEDLINKANRAYRNNKVNILVYWPSVEVKNEYDKAITIDDLYAKVTIFLDGTIPFECRGFNLIRTTYNRTQFICHYVHSHVPSLDYHNLAEYHRPCLGNGAIIGTINDLHRTSDEINPTLTPTNKNQ